MGRTGRKGKQRVQRGQGGGEEAGKDALTAGSPDAALYDSLDGGASASAGSDSIEAEMEAEFAKEEEARLAQAAAGRAKKKEEQAAAAEAKAKAEAAARLAQPVSQAGLSRIQSKAKGFLDEKNRRDQGHTEIIRRYHNLEADARDQLKAGGLTLGGLMQVKDSLETAQTKRRGEAGVASLNKSEEVVKAANADHADHNQKLAAALDVVREVLGSE